MGSLQPHPSALRAGPQSAEDGPACCLPGPAGRPYLSEPRYLRPPPYSRPTHSPCLRPVSRHLTALLPFPDPPGPRLGDKPQTLACGTRALPEQLAQQSSGRGGWDGPPQNSHADWAADLAQGTGLKMAGGRRPYTLGWDQLFQLSTFKCQDCTKQTNSRKMHVSEQHRRHQPPAGTPELKPQLPPLGVPPTARVSPVTRDALLWLRKAAISARPSG